MSKSKIAGVIALAAGFAIASSAMAATYTFTKTLKVGSTGVEVLNLQKVLNSSADTQVSSVGAGSPGNETTYFGNATKAAVIKFQEKYASDILAPVGLTKGTGLVGASTRAHLNTTTKGTTTTTTTGSTTTTTTQSGPVTVALSNDNPAAAAIVAGQATADLAHFTFSGNGTISTVKLVRTGISSNTTLSNVYLYEGNKRVSDAASVNNTDSTITFNNVNLAVSGSVNVAVKADIASANTSGQIVGVQLTSYTVAGNVSNVSISGNLMTVATASLAGVTVSNQTTANANVNAGTIGYTFWSATANVTTRAVSLKGATFEYIGSAPTDALQNARLYVNGSAVGSTATISAANKLSFDFGSSPVTLNTGSSIIEVRADVIKGSNRNVKLTLQNAADIVAADSQLGVNVALGSFTVLSGGVVTINTGSITTVADPSFNSVTTVTGGATNATLAKFKLTAYGEDVKVQSLVVTPAFTTAPTPAANGLNNVALFYNGSQVGTTQNMAGTSTALTFTLGSSMIVEAGKPGVLEVRADLQSAANANYTAGTVAVTLAQGSSNGQGQSSMNTANVPAAAITPAALTINTGALSIAQSAGYAAAQTVNPNTSNVKVGSYVLQNTSSSEAIRVTNLAVGLTFATTTITNISNLRTSETSGSGSTPINPTASNNFSVNFELAAGQSKTIDIMADLGADSVGTITSTLLPTVIGKNSNVTLTPGTATNGQVLTLATGTLAVPTLNPAPSSLAAQFVVGGSQNLGVSQYNFVATNGDATISELKFAVGGTATNPITTVTVGGQSASVVNGLAYLTGLSIAVPKGAAGTNVNVQASFSTVGVNGVTSNTTATTSLTFMKYTIGGVTTSTSTIAVPSNTLTVVGTKPTVTIAASSDALLNGQVKIAEITVAADAAGDLKLVTLPISVSSTGAVTVASTTGIVVTDAYGTTIATTDSGLTVGAGLTGTSTITISNGGVLIPAGTSKTFRINVTAANVSGAVNTIALSTKLGASSLFTWNDMQGGVNGITGAQIYNYPTNTTSIHN